MTKSILCIFVVELILQLDGKVLESPEQNMIPYNESSRYFAMPDDAGEVHIIDKEKSTKLAFRGLFSKPPVPKFFLYTRRNRDDPDNIIINNTEVLKSSHFKPELATKVVIHGWRGSASSEISQMIKEAFLDAADVNVVLVDWQKGAKSMLYLPSASQVLAVGAHIAKMLTFIYQTYGLDVRHEDIHIVGHSLGAHVAANAGRALHGKVNAITGLDPAGPLWSESHRIKKCDARYVEVIHTNAGYAGQKDEAGDVDFYPNGGQQMPGCGAVLFQACSHSKAYHYFAESLTRQAVFPAVKCKDKDEAISGKCHNTEQMVVMGTLVLKKPSGVYYLETNDKPPYGKIMV